MNTAPAALRRTTERGSMLVMVILLVLVLGGLTFASLQVGMGARADVSLTEASTRALEIAEAGLVRAEIEIRTQQDEHGDGIGTVQGSWGGGSFDVTAAQDGTRIDDYTLTAVGTHGLTARRIEAGLRRIPTSPFTHALFAKEDLLVGGSPQTDSFDSRLGTWAEQAVNVGPDGPYADEEGDVGANDDLKVEGSDPVIRGSARAGPLGVLTIEGSPTISGTTDPLEAEIDLPDVTLSEYTEAFHHNDNDQLLTQEGYDPATYVLNPGGKKKIVLQGGTYFFRDVVFEGNTKLEVKKPSRVYVTGKLVLKGGSLVNNVFPAGNLQVLVHPYPLPASPAWTPSTAGEPQIYIEGGEKAALTLYAPGADAQFAGNAEVFGALVARNIEVKGSARFHYDRALGFLDLGQVKRTVRLYWLDRNLPPR